MKKGRLLTSMITIYIYIYIYPEGIYAQGTTVSKSVQTGVYKSEDWCATRDICTLALNAAKERNLCFTGKQGIQCLKCHCV